MIVSWFSAGVSSAVATKLVVKDIDKIIYTHIDDQHPDTMRFIKDCEIWFGKPIEIIQSPLKSVNNAMLSARYVNGALGAPCTRLLKRKVRLEWEWDREDLTYVWGMDVTEKHRCERIIKSMPEQKHIFPLVDRGIGKAEAHEILNASGIKRPVMYDLGFHNNNCRCCCKGGRGYFNLSKKLFPEIFQLRSETERIIGGSCIKGVYLDELSPDEGNQPEPILDDCGIFCELMCLL